MTDTAQSFVDAATNALAYLKHEHGFIIHETIAPAELRTTMTLYKVTYRKVQPPAFNHFVTLSTAPARLEQDLYVGRGWPSEHANTINLFELLHIEAPEATLEFRSGICEGFGKPHAMSEQYSTLGTALRTYGARFFANDTSLWDAVHQLRQQRIQWREDEQTSRLAEAAFKSNEWQRAVELLEALGDNRTKLQSARLAFARKRVPQ